MAESTGTSEVDFIADGLHVTGTMTFGLGPMERNSNGDERVPIVIDGFELKASRVNA